MTETACRWMISLTRKRESLSGGPLAPTLLHMPPDVFINICEWLSVRDVLALRMTNKSFVSSTNIPNIWLSFLRRLLVPLPILPATSRYRFGEILPSTYESLMRRALYLEQNWRRRNPIGQHSRFQAFGRAIVIRMLPGGKYMVSVIKNIERYTLVLWDMDHEGARIALACVNSNTPFLKLDVKYSMVKNLMSIVIAFSKPPVKKNEHDSELSTQVCVFSVPIIFLEELSRLPRDSDYFESSLERPFRMIHESWTACDVGQLVLEYMNNALVLLVLYRPCVLVFHYIESGQQGNLILGPVQPYPTLRHAIWSVKLLAGQNSILVSRVLVEVGVGLDSTLFVLDMFLLPSPGCTYKHPSSVGRQIISGLHADGFCFSDLESSWFHSLRDPEGLLPAAGNLAPPPLSIFITTRKPRGFLHCVLPPIPVPYESIMLPYGRGSINRYCYELPAAKVQRHTWSDEWARPVVLPGAYRSIVLMRPHVSPELLKEGAATAGALEILRFCTFGTRACGYDNFATPRTVANYPAEGTQAAPDADAETMQVDQNQPLSLMDLIQKPTLPLPEISNDIAWKMMHGTTAIAFDESVGKLCVGITKDSDIHVLDFGGENWEVPVIL